MKKAFLIAGAAIVLASCNKGANTLNVSGTVKGLQDGTKVYIGEIRKESPSELIYIDSTEVKDGKFTFKADVTTPDTKYFEFDKGKNQYGQFVFENGDLVVEYDTEKPNEYKISGTKNNDYITAFKNAVAPITKKQQDFMTSKIKEYEEAAAKNDMVTIEKIQKEFSVFEQEYNKAVVDFVKKNKDAIISLDLITQLAQAKKATTKELNEYFDALDASIKELPKAADFKELLTKLSSIEIGSVAPDFSGPNPEGKTVSLKESLGKVTILDFWASWCGPCRQENPNVVKVYEKYKDKGLAIVGVSFDEDAARWKKAIEDDKLHWTQISNLKAWKDPIAKLYNINAIPATFILDEKGVIVARDLRGEDLENKIAELLK